MRNIREEKNALRAYYRELRNALPSDRRQAWDAAICQRISSLGCFRFAKTLLLYAPKDEEINVLPLFEAATARGIACAFPRCQQEEGVMHFYYVHSLDELEVGKFGIREPKESAPMVTSFENSLLIVPAVVFDKQGHRIGYGKGYFDRFISRTTTSPIGVIYEDFVIDNLPFGRYDAIIPLIVSQKAIHIIQ